MHSNPNSCCPAVFPSITSKSVACEHTQSGRETPTWGMCWHAASQSQGRGAGSGSQQTWTGKRRYQTWVCPTFGINGSVRSGASEWTIIHCLYIFPPPAAAVSKRTEMHFLINCAVYSSCWCCIQYFRDAAQITWGPSAGYMFHTTLFQFLVLLSQHSIAMSGRKFSGRQFTLRLPQIITFEISTDFIIRVWFCLQP